MIYVTHDQTEALTFADKVVVMHDGEVVQTGTPEELFERPAHTFVGHFIGSPGMNVLPCRDRGRDRLGRGRDDRAAAQPIRRCRADKRIELGIRPEFVALRANGAGPSGHRAPHRRSRPRPHRPRRDARPAARGERPGERVDHRRRGGLARHRSAARFTSTRTAISSGEAVRRRWTSR